MKICGIDFTSRPGARKPIVVAVGRQRGQRLNVVSIEPLQDFAAFEAWLAASGPWVGGFDFPFGLPRRFVDAFAQARDWASLVAWARGLGREGFCALAHPAFSAAKGRSMEKHRAVDALAGSHSPLKTMDPQRRRAINPPVGLMFFEGAPRLAAAGQHLPGLRENGDPRVAVEAYPGLAARQLGVRRYKNDKPESAVALRGSRSEILRQLGAGQALGIPVSLAPPLARQCIDDASGDCLDAVLCALQAAWSAQRADAGFGLPAQVDPVEGWIATVPPP